MVHDLISRLRSLLRRQQAEDDMQNELQYHLQRESEKYIRAGLFPEEATRRARIALGGLEQIRQQCREARGTLFVQNLMQDLRYAARTLAKNSGFSMVVILTLALGIGSCAAVFSLITAVLFPPLPYGDVSRLAYVTTPNRHLTDVPPDAFLPDNADFVDLKRESHSFSGMTQFQRSKLKLAFRGAQSPIDGAKVDGDFFATLEMQPELGRPINSRVNQRGHDDVALISHSLWQQMFAESRDVLGRALQLNGKQYRIIGVMPREFHYPQTTELDYGKAHMNATEVWVPLALCKGQVGPRTFRGKLCTGADAVRRLSQADRG
jgi:hypothetical protein